MRRARQTTAVLGIGGLSLIALLTGCSTGEAADGDTSTDSGSTGTDSSETDSGDTSTDAATGAYNDGDYSATGEYQTPDGTQSIDVELTLADGTVDAVTVTGNATGGNSERYQGMFESGISAEVVGVAIDDLAVDRVSGSSLTSDGFNAAVEQIKADALA